MSDLGISVAATLAGTPRLATTEILSNKRFTSELNLFLNLKLEINLKPI